MEPELKTAMDEHMNAEFESYYLYLSMAGYFDDESWPGFSSWMRQQSEEEREHAMKFFSFLLRQGVNPELLDISKPKYEWESPLDAFEDALEHEEKITELIYDLHGKATELGDQATVNLLNWFIDEQSEEEDTVGEIVARLRRVDGDPQGLMILDAELGGRDETDMS